MKQAVPPGRNKSDFRITLNRHRGEWAGKIEHLHFQETFSINGLDEMIFMLHQRLEYTGHPQAAYLFRSWIEHKDLGAPRKGGDHRLKKAGLKAKHHRKDGAPTFFIRVHFRQNATWQGSIQWLERGGSRHFRSMLEMIMLMKEAVDMSGGSEIILSSWEDEEESLS